MWISKSADAHACQPPALGATYGIPVPDGKPGDVWMCDDCLTVWRVVFTWQYCNGNGSRRYFNVWRQAGWWRSRQARRAVGWA